jgi:hypothetical protein
MMTHRHLNTKLGFHYYPDSEHFRRDDILKWLPRLEYLGASWITLVAHPNRAIPEYFIRSLVEQNITPVLHIPIQVDRVIRPKDLEAIFSSYANWGVKYVAMFDRPNMRSSWQDSNWSQANLEERFLDRFLPFANLLVERGLSPVFPPLEPGGDYWDMVFLKKSFQGMIRRNCTQILSRMVLGTYAWSYGKPLNWGIGGPANWKSNLPYVTPEDSQDQIGFHSFEWHLAQVESVLGLSIPGIILKAGHRNQDSPKVGGNADSYEQHTEKNLAILEWLREGSNAMSDLLVGPPPKHILACNFWLLAAQHEHPAQEDCWFPANDRPRPIVDAVTRLFTQSNNPVDLDPQVTVQIETKPQGHYVLVDQDIDHDRRGISAVAQPFAERKHADIGTSFIQALNARRVTLIGEKRWLDDASFSQLRDKGCMIEEFYGSGTTLASKMAHQ